jgi:steroid delta-isomerase-like uncharacterized protein
MSAEQNKSLILQFYRAFDERKIDQAVELLAPNFVAHLAGISRPLNREEFQRFGMQFYLAFSEGEHKFDQIIIEGDKVVTCGTFIARHLGDFQGLPPTGKQIKLAIMHIDRIENGKIAEHWGQGDALGLMQQLGMVFLPGFALLPRLAKSLIYRFLKSKTWGKTLVILKLSANTLRKKIANLYK